MAKISHSFTTVQFVIKFCMKRDLHYYNYMNSALNGYLGFIAADEATSHRIVNSTEL